MAAKEFFYMSGPSAQSFAARLRRIRTAAGVSGYKLAELSGMSKQAISSLELGKRQPTLETAKKLARALGVSLDELTGDGGAAEKPKRKRGK
jgi:transcriptional regulator with XRE-family HTH domain